MAERNGREYPLCFGVNGQIYELNPLPIGGVLDGWWGDESTGFGKEELDQRLNNHQNNSGHNEEVAPPLVRSGRPDPAL